ncbi:hypothetical protein [Microbacterium sp.]|uniref:hypothetical protein n=1 Tax=Microbacterium sp. TaxID=51671 RepID=UPI00333FA8C9
MNIKVARLTNPSELWMFQDEFIHSALRVATCLIVKVPRRMAHPSENATGQGLPSRWRSRW